MLSRFVFLLGSAMAVAAAVAEKQGDVEVVFSFVVFIVGLMVSISSYNIAEAVMDWKVTKYYLAKLPNQVFIENSTGAIYTTDDVYSSKSLIMALAFYPGLTTKSEEALRPGIGASTLVVVEYKDMEDFTYVGRL